MLIKNKCYTSHQLMKIFGGSSQPSMPFVHGKVPYCKFNPKLNPEFPARAWIEIGPIRKKGAQFLINSNNTTPIFQKKAVNNWIFIGFAKISDVTSINKLEMINNNPPRDKVQFILQFTFI